MDKTRVSIAFCESLQVRFPLQFGTDFNSFLFFFFLRSSSYTLKDIWTTTYMPRENPLQFYYTHFQIRTKDYKHFIQG